MFGHYSNFRKNKLSDADIAAERGHVDGADLAAVRAAGFDDGAIVEIVNVALNVLTNYINNVAETDIDFPAADKLAA